MVSSPSSPRCRPPPENCFARSRQFLERRRRLLTQPVLCPHPSMFSATLFLPCFIVGPFTIPLAPPRMPQQCRAPSLLSVCPTSLLRLPPSIFGRSSPPAAFSFRTSFCASLPVLHWFTFRPFFSQHTGHRPVVLLSASMNDLCPFYTLPAFLHSQ